MHAISGSNRSKVQYMFMYITAIGVISSYTAIVLRTTTSNMLYPKPRRHTQLPVTLPYTPHTISPSLWTGLPDVPDLDVTTGHPDAGVALNPHYPRHTQLERRRLSPDEVARVTNWRTRARELLTVI